jgi:hypothetical protein
MNVKGDCFRKKQIRRKGEGDGGEDDLSILA